MARAFEMTRDQWEFELIRTGTRKLYGKGSYGLTLAHKEEIRAAIEAGQVVPETILSSYPELETTMAKVRARLKLKKQEVIEEVAVQTATATEAVPEPTEATVAVAEQPAPAAERSPVDLSGVDLDAYGKRWQAGESIARLAREIGSVSWNYLHSRLTALGYSMGK